MGLWVLVANSSFAEIFSVIGKNVNLVQKIDFPDGRLKSGKILTDRPGRGFDSMGGNRHAYGTEVDPHAHEQKVFAHQLAEVLHKAKSNNSFVQLDIIAPPQFLGALRSVLAEPVRRTLNKEINKEISPTLTEREKIELIRKYLDLPSPVPSTTK